MDENLLIDLRNALEDALECDDWKCVEEALDICKELQGESSDDDEEEESDDLF